MHGARGERSAIRLVDAGKRYGSGAWGVRGVDLEIRPGAITALVGPNGAGKSTTLNLMGGVIFPTQGQVHVTSGNGLVGWCPQSNLIDWSLTVRQNVLFGARLRGLRGRVADQAVDEAMELTQITSVAGREAESLSGGQLRRTLIARALVGRPQVLILDEPASGLDPVAADRVFEYLRGAAHAGALVICSSHDLHALERFADRLVMLDSGSVVYDGDVAGFEPDAGHWFELRLGEAASDEGLLTLARSLGADEAEADGVVIRVRTRQVKDFAPIFTAMAERVEIVDVRHRDADLRSRYVARMAGSASPEEG